ncbi:MAG: DNA repair protein RecN [Rikenellaceae bacterium]
MITKLHIENYVLIDYLDIDFEKGLNIITGETGAGKSILLGALSLLKGARADSSSVNGAKNCIIEATFDCEGYGIEPLFDELELDYEDQTIIRRVIASNGKSRAYINDLPVQLAQLKPISDSLIDIHSQHQTLLVGTNTFQMEVVDCVAENGKILENYKCVFSEFQTIKTELSSLKSNAESAKKEEEFLRYQYTLIDDANIKEGEKLSLEEQHRVLANAELIKKSLYDTTNYLSENDESVLANLKYAINSLSEISELSSLTSEIYERLESSLEEVKDINRELCNMADDAVSDPRALESIEERLNTIYSLEQRFHVDSDTELLSIKQDLEAKLGEIDNFDESILDCKKRLDKKYTELKVISEKLEQRRKKVIPKIEKNVISQLKDLGMAGSRLQIELDTLEELNSSGQNVVKFMFSANEGGILEKIDKVASGGEMSRLMLTLKSIMAEHKSLPTIIFDEIDTGVSGHVADKMGEIMEKLGSAKQVINITHLPQVASKGLHHFFVSKRVTDGKTITNITKLDLQSRIEHIASMISGKGVTNAAIEQAKELLKI